MPLGAQLVLFEVILLLTVIPLSALAWMFLRMRITPTKRFLCAAEGHDRGESGYCLRCEHTVSYVPPTYRPGGAYRSQECYVGIE